MIFVFTCVLFIKTEGFKFLDCKSWSCEGFLANLTILPTNGYRVLSAFKNGKVRVQGGA